MPYTSNPFFTPDLKIYVTKDEMSETINKYVSKNELPDFTKYAKTSELPSFTKYVKTSELPDLSLYAKTSELPDLSLYVKTNELPDLSLYVKTNELPDLSLYAKKNELPDLSLYAKKSELPDLSLYAKKSELPLYAKTSVVKQLISNLAAKDCEYIMKYSSLIRDTDKSERYKRCIGQISESRLSTQNNRHCISHADCDVGQRCFEHIKNRFIQDGRCHFYDHKSCTCRR